MRAIVNCKVLWLIVVTICKSPINPITNPNPVSSHLKLWQYLNKVYRQERSNRLTALRDLQRSFIYLDSCYNCFKRVLQALGRVTILMFILIVVGIEALQLANSSTLVEFGFPAFGLLASTASHDRFASAGSATSIIILFLSCSQSLVHTRSEIQFVKKTTTHSGSVEVYCNRTSLFSSSSALSFVVRRPRLRYFSFIRSVHLGKFGKSTSKSPLRPFSFLTSHHSQQFSHLPLHRPCTWRSVAK
jgi:hypothetical protein